VEKIPGSGTLSLRSMEPFSLGHTVIQVMITATIHVLTQHELKSNYISLRDRNLVSDID
jgi:hypothetical protein